MDTTVRNIGNKLKLEYLLRKVMTDEQFWKWVSQWYDVENIFQCINTWDNETIEHSIKEVQEILNYGKQE